LDFDVIIVIAIINIVHPIITIQSKQDIGANLN